ncbi:MAG: hypothetical protein ACRCZF_16735, partial [Gemmataceae bacterium]
MASRMSRFHGWTKKLFGHREWTGQLSGRAAVSKDLVQLETRDVPATFTVTNILDSQVDVVGGFSLRQAILAANANPGFDRIDFNIPISPSLPKRSDGTNYFPIVLASTLPDLTDADGVEIAADTQPRPRLPNPDAVSAELVPTILDNRPIIQLLPDPNPGAFPGDKGAYYVTGSNNVIRGFVITGFPGSGVNIAGGSRNTVIGNFINTDIEGNKAWFQDQLLAKFRRQGLAKELTNDERGTVLAGITLLGNGGSTKGAQDNIIGGLYDRSGSPLVNAIGDVIGFGGTVTRNVANPGDTPDVVQISELYNANVISGTPEFRRDFPAVVDGVLRDRDLTGAGAGPGIRFMDPFTRGNMVQGNVIGGSAPDINALTKFNLSDDKKALKSITIPGVTDLDLQDTLVAIPNHNGIEFVNGASSNYIGNPAISGTNKGAANLIRFNTHDGVRVAPVANYSRDDDPGAPIVQFGPPISAFDPYRTFDLTAALRLDQTNLPLFHDGYSANYYDGVSSEVDLSGNRPQVIQVGVPNPVGANPPIVPGLAGQVGTKITINGRNLLGLTGVAFR